MPNCEICDKNEIRLKKRISQGNEHKICSRCYSIITKNMRDVKTKYTVSKENLENISASTPECHIKNIANNAVKGIPISKAAIVALRCATILTVATRNPLTITFSTNSIIL